MSNSNPEKPRLKKQLSQARETHPELEQRQEPSMLQSNFQDSEPPNSSSKERETRSNLTQGQVNSTPEINSQHSQSNTALSQVSKLHTLSVQDQENSSSHGTLKGFQLKKASVQISEPRSAQDLCARLNQLVQETKWDTKQTAEQFISLIVNQNRQYVLEPKQKKILASAIINCPQEHRALVHLAIATANFTKTKRLPNLDGIIPQIGSYVSEELELKPQNKETLLKAQTEQNFFEWLKKKLNPDEIKKDAKLQPVSYKNIVVKQPEAESEQGRSNSNDTSKTTFQKKIASTRKEESAKKINFVRNLITLLLCEGDSAVIPTRLNIILAVFADSNYWRNLTTELPNPEVDIQYRVKAISEFFRLPNPAGTDAERLLLYGASAQFLTTKQVEEIADFKNSWQKEKELVHQRQEQIDQLQKQSTQLQKQLVDAQQKLEEMQIQLENEKKLYKRLEQASQAEIIQERNAVFNKITNRIEHELKILDKCLSGSPESFQINSKVGRQNVENIRKSIKLEEK